MKTKETVLLRDRRETELVHGPNDSNLKLVKKVFKVSVTSREGLIAIEGDEEGVTRTARVLEEIKSRGELGGQVGPAEVENVIEAVRNDVDLEALDRIEVFRKEAPVVPRTQGQERYVAAMRRADIVFGIGPRARARRTWPSRWPRPRFAANTSAASCSSGRPSRPASAWAFCPAT